MIFLAITMETYFKMYLSLVATTYGLVSDPHFNFI